MFSFISLVKKIVFGKSFWIFQDYFSRLQTLGLATCFNKRRKTQACRPQRRIFVCGCLCVGHYCQAILLFRGLVNALVDPSLPHFSPELLKFKNSVGYKYLVIPVSIGIPTYITLDSIINSTNNAEKIFFWKIKDMVLR